MNFEYQYFDGHLHGMSTLFKSIDLNIEEPLTEVSILQELERQNMLDPSDVECCSIYQDMGDVRFYVYFDETDSAPRSGDGRIVHLYFRKH